MTAESPLRQTALLAAHLESGGKIVPFAGWELPVQYAGVKAETVSVRQNCGLFDVSHMGQFDVRGEGATQTLNAIVSADWSKIRVGRAAYALLLTQNGGVLDDVMGYHLSKNHWLVVVNGSRAEVDEGHLRALLPPHIELSNRYANQAMIAVQGPQSQTLLQPLCDANLGQMTLRDALETEVLGQKCVVTRGGYTGCDGFEWMGDAATAPQLWKLLLDAGAAPCGLGARDVLRLEAGLPLYGHELREDLSPDESGVSFAVKMEKGDFFGREGLQHKRQSPPPIALRGLQMEGRAIAREGYEIQYNGEVVGVVTSGSPSPTLDANIALALVPVQLTVGNSIEVLIRNTPHPARIVALPFVARTTKTSS
ncbi:MAG: glycine cleavage system aminomethyltransferase GcvT [Armatimonadetes bacterium]|nr:glycine cleavage system aminomethyltransferase GcvT [Armatimonadota bacterium]